MMSAAVRPRRVDAGGMEAWRQTSEGPPCARAAVEQQWQHEAWCAVGHTRRFVVVFSTQLQFSRDPSAYPPNR